VLLLRLDLIYPIHVVSPIDFSIRSIIVAI